MVCENWTSGSINNIIDEYKNKLYPDESSSLYYYIPTKKISIIPVLNHRYVYPWSMFKRNIEIMRLSLCGLIGLPCEYNV